MATKKTRLEKIRLKAVEILSSNNEGFRYSQLMRKIAEEYPDFPHNTINGAVWDLDKNFPKKIYKPSRGLFRHKKFSEEDVSVEPSKKNKEEDFYKPFADWLVNETEECTKAISLGGNKFKGKWGTPDVIGVRVSRRSDIIQSPTEVVSAEIKLDTRELITAFGQACSYKLFSHKSYVVIPKKSLQDDISRLDALCLIFGMGLVLFDTNDVNDPKYEIKARPVKYDPDMFYVNKVLKIVEKDLF